MLTKCTPWFSRSQIADHLALERRTRSRTYVGACDGACDGASSAIIQRRTHALIEKKKQLLTLELELQAVVSWASLLCVYIVFDGFQDCMLSIFYANDLVRSITFGGARPPTPTPPPLFKNLRHLVLAQQTWNWCTGRGVATQPYDIKLCLSLASHTLCSERVWSRCNYRVVAEERHYRT